MKADWDFWDWLNKPEDTEERFWYAKRIIVLIIVFILIPMLIYFVVKWDPVIGFDEDGEPRQLGIWIIIALYWGGAYFIAIKDEVRKRMEGENYNLRDKIKILEDKIDNLRNNLGTLRNKIDQLKEYHNDNKWELYHKVIEYKDEIYTKDNLIETLKWLIVDNKDQKMVETISKIPEEILSEIPEEEEEELDEE